MQSLKIWERVHDFKNDLIMKNVAGTGGQSYSKQIHE